MQAVINIHQGGGDEEEAGRMGKVEADEAEKKEKSPVGGLINDPDGGEAGQGNNAVGGEKGPVS